jgi:hypothetical protein
MADAPLPARRRKRFSLSGTIGFERRIGADQRRIVDQTLAVLPPDHFRTLLLCGAYGRGEGVRLRDANGREIADRYQYGVILGRTEARLRAAVDLTLKQLAGVLSATTGVAIEYRIFREEQLQAAKPLSYPMADLRWSGRLLHGDPHPVARMTERPFEHLAPGELLWQLIREGQQLLRNQEQLRASTSLTPTEQLTFFRRLITAVLMCGDLRLATSGRYHPSHPEKLRRLEALDERHHRKFMALYQLAHRAYADLDTQAFATGHPLDWQARVVWLWLDALRRFERWRRGRDLPGWEPYCHPYPGKGQGHVARLGERLAANLATFGLSGLRSHPLWSLRHPRERLIGALPLLLGEPRTSPEPAVAAALSLPTGTSWPRTVEVFLSYYACYQG